MKQDVKQCVDARLNFFEQYYTVPEEMANEVESFSQEVLSLAEKCDDSIKFEAEFASKGLSEKFNSLIMRCTPKPYEMSAEEKTASKEVRKELFEENKGQLAKDIVNDITDSVVMYAESEASSRMRRQMADEGVLDDYTRASNAVEDAGWLARSIGKFFKKKHN